jgi:hypothetical protein
MTQQDYKHPITPSPQLVKQWCHDRNQLTTWTDFENVLAIRAAQWGADAELTACCAWIGGEIGATDPNDLYVARRPKLQSPKERAIEIWYDNHILDRLIAVEKAVGLFPSNPSLREQTLCFLDSYELGKWTPTEHDWAIIRRALGQLPDNN